LLQDADDRGGLDPVHRAQRPHAGGQEAVATFRQLGYAFGIAVLGEVFSGGLTRVAGSGLAPALSGGEASAVLARRPGLSIPVHEAFAAGLDQTLLVAAGLAIIGALAVFTFVRTPAAVPPASPATSAKSSAQPGLLTPSVSRSESTGEIKPLALPGRSITVPGNDGDELRVPGSLVLSRSGRLRT
jgi:hypothetical protein